MAARLRDRLHWIVLRGSLLLITVAGAVGVPLGLIRAWRSDQLLWNGDTGVQTSLPHGLFLPTRDTQAIYDGHLDVVIDNPPHGLSLLAALPDLLTTVAVSVVAAVLLTLVLRAQEGRPFAGNGARLLQAAAAVIALAGVTVPLAGRWVNDAVVDRAGQLGPRLGGASAISTNTNVTAMLIWLGVALLVLTAARAFGEGQRLAQDTEGLV